MKSFGVALAGAALLAVAASAAFPSVSHADTFTFTSCHVSSSACQNGSVPSGFGTVMLTQSGSDVKIDVVLTNGNTFAETGASGGFLFLFNDAVAGSTVASGGTVTLNGADVTATAVPGGLSGVTNQTAPPTMPPGPGQPIMADGTGTFTAAIGCTVASDCNGGNNNFNDLHFTVTNVMVAQLETANANGNIFVADIFCGPTQTGCANGLTGDVDVSVPGPIVGAGLPGLVLACAGLVGLARRRRKIA